ncbi:enoyl-CoA hydratase/isomerase family protein, putative [Eimeria tenella]|uniref:Enoyl-CoA hydratase/isomerase family protein, putative n=1 Tax=Eimeria tenella TaxID=5802 RepID=U6KUT8_EIMTE|nr:enoyl-CoA hydratase/isomerase family protein, putative [Eimeria tenella]CDJ41726.1 enoyl-CoA hydratase/isomerase family protein, putative [Eimeria tenella]|eukprot:XP_013232476.1 enoyl-CoA hydratase/isomerase family protein, putative [Eimeria tenella]
MEYPKLLGPSQGGVYTIHLGTNENRIDFEFIQDIEQLLTKIEAKDGPTACVITGEGKFFSNGLNLDVLMAQPKELLGSFHCLLSRLLSFPVPLVAAINGHAFAGGAMLALACDFRVMNRKRGFLCINEVDNGLPLTPGMCAIIKSKIDRSLWASTILGARRWTGEDCLRSRIVDAACDPGEVLQQAQALAAREAPRGASKILYKGLKEEIFAEEIKLLSSGVGGVMQIVPQVAKVSKM